ncbi:hypothetical protein [Modestobacter sp. SYSU DS0511]
MILAVIGVTWLSVSVVVGCVLGRTITVANGRDLDRDDVLPLDRPLYVTDILAAERPSSAAAERPGTTAAERPSTTAS